MNVFLILAATVTVTSLVFSLIQREEIARRLRPLRVRRRAVERRSR